MKRVATRVLCAVLAASLAVPTTLMAAPALPSATMGRVPEDRRARIQELMPRLNETSAAALRTALSGFDKHSSYWKSLKWAADSGGAVLGPIFAGVGIAAAGKVLGFTALEAMKWGGPAIWAIGATAGLAGFAGLVYHQHSTHWYPRALEALDAAIEEAARAAGPAAPTGTGDGTITAAAPRAAPGQPMGLLGVTAQR